MEATMTRRRTTGLRLSLKVGFEPRRGGGEALADAYERLLPSLSRPVRALPKATRQEEVHDDAAGGDRGGGGALGPAGPAGGVRTGGTPANRGRPLPLPSPGTPTFSGPSPRA